MSTGPKLLGLYVVTFLVVYVIGTVLQTAFFGIVTGSPLLVFANDIEGFPSLGPTLCVSLPLAILASVLAWGLATLFAYIGKRQKRFSVWLIFMVVTGLIIGGLCAIPTLWYAVDEFNGLDGTKIIATNLASFATAGAFAGAVLSPLWFFANSKQSIA